MPFFVVRVINRADAESEAVSLLEGAPDGVALVRGEEVKFRVEVIRRVVIDTRTLPLPFIEQQPPAPVEQPVVEVAAPVVVEKPKTSPKGKYGGKSVPEQVREFLIAHAPESYTAADIAASLGVPRGNANTAVANLRKRGVVTGSGKVRAVIANGDGAAVLS